MALLCSTFHFRKILKTKINVHIRFCVLCICQTRPEHTRGHYVISYYLFLSINISFWFVFFISLIVLNSFAYFVSRILSWNCLEQYTVNNYLIELMEIYDILISYQLKSFSFQFVFEWIIYRTQQKIKTVLVSNPFPR